MSTEGFSQMRDSMDHHLTFQTVAMVIRIHFHKQMGHASILGFLLRVSLWSYLNDNADMPTIMVTRLSGGHHLEHDNELSNKMKG